MRSFVVFFLLAGGPAMAFAQDPLQLALQAAPRATALAGSPENLASLVKGLTQGTPVRLAAPGPAGYARVVVFTPPARLSGAEAAALLQQVRRDFDLLGIAEPTAEQLAAALVGGVVDTPTGSTGLGVRSAPVSTSLEPAPHPPTPEEQALAALPPEIRDAVAGLPPREALRTVAVADQQLIALGTPYASGERRVDLVWRVRYGDAYTEASAGQTSFPPLSPLVPLPQR